VYLGYNANSSNPDEIHAAEMLLKAVRPYIKYFSSTKMLTDLPNKDVCIAMSWSGDYLTARDRAREAGVHINLAYTVPKEGSVFWFDALFIPSDAPHPGNATLFINYMLRPEVLADASNFISYATATADGYPLVREELRNDPAVYPTESILKVLHPNKALPPKLERLRTRAWARFKTGM
jgi:putrescine transport system substrate-binding protein